jgi:hypothetical protein
MQFPMATVKKNALYSLTQHSAKIDNKYVIENKELFKTGKIIKIRYELIRNYCNLTLVEN